MPSGHRLLNDRYLNKGTAFSRDERDRFGLHGMLPPVVEELSTQLERTAVEFDMAGTDLERHLMLRALQDRNSVLFYAFVRSRLDDLLPIVYTPTVGVACQQWSRIYRRQRGLYLSWPLRDRVGDMLDAFVGDRDIDVVVVTDGERVLGLGDLGVGGMGIPIGKLALYTAVGGIDPARTMPVVLDTGTDNDALLSDPLYLGWRHARVRGAEYDELVDAFVDVVRARFPGAVLQWEDFAQVNAHRLLARHRDRISSFNDDVQGTAVVTAASIAAGLRITGVPLGDLRVVIVGAGSAGTGIAGQVVELLVRSGLDLDTARRRCWLVDRHGLLHTGLDGLLDFQVPFSRPWDEVAGWDHDGDGQIDLVDVVAEIGPHALVGVTGQPGLFTHEVIGAMAGRVDRPIVLPLSNPTPRAEAIPADVIAWTGGRALVGTGSPFAPVSHDGRSHEITQVNNIYVFPGVGLGAVISQARMISDAMLAAAVEAISLEAARSVTAGPERLLPPVGRAHEIARAVAIAVAEAAVAEGLAPEPDSPFEVLVDRLRWEPVYRPISDEAVEASPPNG